jgi:squalene-associated FAD-dependent desaturase
VPGTSAADYFRLARLLFVRKDVPVCSTLACAGPLYERLVQPLLLAALNIDPREGSAALASTIVRETLLRGGRACRPLVAREGLSGVFIEPALKHLRERNVGVRLEHELRGLRMAGDEIEALDFGADAIRLGRTDAVILAVPAHAAAGIVPGLQTPQGYRAIANAHFRIAAPAHLPPMIGVINGTVEWIFTFKDRLSVTISSADRLLDQPRQELAQALWREVSAVTGVAGELPPWQVVRERRATFAATPAENARRPGARTPWRNLFLAGDWTATGLPATLESAVRSGNRAAELAGAVAGVTT